MNKAKEYWINYCINNNIELIQEIKSASKVLSFKKGKVKLMKYILNWTNLGYKTGLSPQEIYLLKYYEWDFSHNDRLFIENILGLLNLDKNYSFMNIDGMTLDDIIKAGFSLDLILNCTDINSKKIYLDLFLKGD